MELERIMMLYINMASLVRIICTSTDLELVFNRNSISLRQLEGKAIELNCSFADDNFLSSLCQARAELLHG